VVRVLGLVETGAEKGELSWKGETALLEGEEGWINNAVDEAERRPPPHWFRC
jgi:hypothetical protein